MTNKLFNLNAVKSTYGLNQKRLSELLGVSHALISRYESNPNLMPVQYIIELSELFHFKIDDFIKDSFTKNTDLKPFAYTKNWWLEVSSIKQKFFSIFSDTETKLSESNIDKKTHEFVQRKLLKLPQQILHEIFHKPTIAVVGELSSGKTTLIELLTGKKSPLKDFPITTFYVKSRTGKELTKYYNIPDNSPIPNIRLLDSENYLSELTKLECEKESANIAIIYMNSNILDVCNLIEVHITGMDNFYNIKCIRKQALSSSDAIALLYTETISRNSLNEIINTLKYPKGDSILDNLFFITNRIQENNNSSYAAELFQKQASAVNYLWLSESENIEIIKERTFLIDYINSKNNSFFTSINSFLRRYYDELLGNYPALLDSLILTSMEIPPVDKNTENLTKTYELIWDLSKECEKTAVALYSETKKRINQELKNSIAKDNLLAWAKELCTTEDSNFYPSTFSQLKDFVMEISFEFIMEKYSPLIDQLFEQMLESFSSILKTYKNEDKNIVMIFSSFQKINNLSLNNIKDIKEASENEQIDYCLDLQFFDPLKIATGFSHLDFKYNLFQCLIDSFLIYGDNFNSFRKGTTDAKLQRLSEKFQSMDFTLIEKLQDEYFDFLKDTQIPNLKNIPYFEQIGTDTSFINSISAEIQTKFEQIKNSLSLK